MASISDNISSDSYDNALVGLMGGTDNTRIGNVGDRLKIDASSVESEFRPNPSAYETDETSTLKLDSEKNLICRSAVHVDEGSFRTEFNDALDTNLTGTVTFVNGSDTITGSGTSFLSELVKDNYIKLSTDAGEYYTQIYQLISDTEIILYEGYLGASNSGTGNTSKWCYKSNGTGSSISIGGSSISLNSGTDADGYAYIERNIDYCPLQLYAFITVPLRQANQEVIFGFKDDVNSPTKEASVVFNGTSDTNIIFRTRGGATDIKETSIILKASEISSTVQNYEINVLPNKSVLVLNNKVIATHYVSIPFPYDVLKLVCKSRNSDVCASNAVAINSIYVSNINIVSISNTFAGEPLKVQVVSTVDTSIKDFIDGFIATSSSSGTAIRSTTYNEQTTNARRSFKSSSANDKAGGTGAYTLRLTYFDQNIVGPFTETITMNGTTAVNTTASNICYIEKIDVLTAGSTGAAVGTITLYTAINGGGSAIGTIAAASTKTFWCHHYVPPGNICNITGVTVSTTGTVFGNGGNFYMTRTDLLTAYYINQQISDNLVVPGAVPFSSRIYATPIQVSGPSRITGWVKPSGTASYNNYMSFDYFEE